MSERQVRLLYRTTCHTCGDDIVAGTVLWWDDDRRHATCTDCAGDLRPEPRALSGPRPADGARVDERARRRRAVLQARTSA